MKKTCLGLLSVVLMFACGGETQTESSDVGPDVQQVEEVSEVAPDDTTENDVVEVTEEVDELDVVGDADGWELVFPDTVEVQDSGPLPGEAGAPCGSASDCNDGFCIQTTDGLKCTMGCIEDCPFGWDCVLHTASLPDEVYICAPPLVAICRPCEVNKDCMVNGVDTGEACVVYGPAGNFCGGVCEQDSDCPAGYLCLESEDTSGGALLSCTLEVGGC